MAIGWSPSNPSAGSTVAPLVTDSVSGVFSRLPDIILSSVPPDSKIRPGTKLDLNGAPSGEVVYAATNGVDGVTTSLFEANGYWAGATLTFTSGRLSGVSRAIGLDESSSRLPFAEPLPVVPDVGDAFVVNVPQSDPRRRLAFAPDVPGEYSVTASSYVENVTPPSFGGDSSGAVKRTLSDVQTTTIHVAEVVELPIVPVNGHGSTLCLKVANDSVVQAYLADPATVVARAAMLDSGVQSALSALVGETVATVGNALQATANNLRVKYEAHRVRTTSSTHSVADTLNAALTDDAFDDDSAVLLTNRLRKVIYAHLTGSSAAGARWHAEDDTKNVPAIAEARNKGEATILLADLTYRVFPGHLAQIASPAAHGSADAANTIAVAKSDLSELVRVYLSFVTQTSPTIPAGLPEGAATARSRYGFTSRT